MVDSQHFCLRWNNYQSSITSAFENLRDDEDFVDVTLACDGKSLKAHRVVLSACSPYFRELLKSTPCKHPVIVLQNVEFGDLLALVEFIYHGEVNVAQRSLSSFLKTAEVLRISGLTQHENGQGPLAQFQSLGRGGVGPTQTPPGAAHAPHTPSYSEKLEEALSAGRAFRRERPYSRGSDNSPDLIKRTRLDNNNTEQASHMPQVSPADFSTKSRQSHEHAHAPGNGNGVSNSSSSPSPRLLDDVKHEPLDMMCPPDLEPPPPDTPPHALHRPHIPSRGSSAEGEDRSTPLQIPPSPFLPPSDPKLYQNTFNYSMSALTDHSPLAGLGSPGMNADGLAGSSAGGAAGAGGAGVTALGAGHRCDVCGKLLSTRLTLKRHTEQQHLQPLHSARCTLCHKVFRTLNSLNNHKSIYHRRQRPPPAHPPHAPPLPHHHHDSKLALAHHPQDSVFYKFKDQFDV